MRAHKYMYSVGNEDQKVLCSLDSCSDLQRVQVQRMEKVNVMSALVSVFTGSLA